MKWKVGLATACLLAGTLLADVTPVFAQGDTSAHSSQTSAARTTSTKETTSTTSDSTEKTQLSGQLTWQDDNNQFKMRPNQVLVKLLEDGKDTSYFAVATAKNNWQYQFKNIAKKSGAVYTAKIDVFNGYQAKSNGLNIQCTLPMHPVEIRAKKAKGTVLLQKNGKTVEQWKLTAQPKKVALPEGSYSLQPADKQLMPTFFTVTANGNIQQMKAGKTVTVDQVVIEDSKTNSSITQPTSTTSENEKVTMEWGNHDLINWLVGLTNSSEENSSTSTTSTTTTDSRTTTTSSTTASKPATVSSESGHATVEQGLLERIQHWFGKKDESSSDTGSSDQTKNIEVTGQIRWSAPANFIPKKVTVQLEVPGTVAYQSVTTDASKQWKYTFKGVPEEYLPNAKVHVKFVGDGFYKISSKGTAEVNCDMEMTEVGGTITWRDDTDKYRFLQPVLKADKLIAPVKAQIVKNGHQWKYSFAVPRLYKGKEIQYHVDLPQVPGYTRSRVNNWDAVYTLQTEAVRFAPIYQDKQGKSEKVNPRLFWLEEVESGRDKIFPNTNDGQYYLKVGTIYEVKSLASGFKQKPLFVRINPENYRVEIADSINGPWRNNESTTITVPYEKVKVPTLDFDALHNLLSGLGGVAGKLPHFSGLASLFNQLHFPDLGDFKLPQFKGLNLPNLSLPKLGHSNLPSLTANSGKTGEASHIGDLDLTTARHLPQTNRKVQMGLTIIGVVIVLGVIIWFVVRRKKH